LLLICVASVQSVVSVFWLLLFAVAFCRGVNVISVPSTRARDDAWWSARRTRAE
jgi:hypothetical protein